MQMCPNCDRVYDEIVKIIKRVQLILSCTLSLFAAGFYIDIRLNPALDLTVGLLKFLNAVPDQYKNMAVDGAALIIRNKSELFQHLFLNANRYTFCSHSNLRLKYGKFAEIGISFKYLLERSLLKHIVRRLSITFYRLWSIAQKPYLTLV